MPAFTTDQQATIAKFAQELTRRTQRTVLAEYGETEDGAIHDAALCVQSLPVGCWGRPGPLVSILSTGAGFVALDSEGIPVIERASLAEAVQHARFTAMRCWRDLVGN